MDKATQRAELYARSHQKLGYDYCYTFDAVKYGYLQAEKDLALTWEDIKDIDEWISVVQTSDNLVGKELYEEVLRRFNEQRAKK